MGISAKKIKLLKEFENEQIFIGSMHWLFEKKCSSAKYTLG